MPISHIFQSQCMNKAPYETKEQAEAAAAQANARLRKAGGRNAQKVNVYQCPQCLQWHIGRRKNKGKHLNR